MTRDDIDAASAIQGETEVLLVRSAWDAATWQTVKADVEETADSSAD